MKKIYIILFLLIGILQGFSQNSLTGKITDKITGEPMVGASIYIAELKKGDVTDMDGNYRINNLSSSRILVQVNSLGYKTIIETIDLSQNTTRDFVMEVSIKEVNEVVVTGLSSAAEKNRTPTPISVIGKTQLLQASSTNIIDAIATQPGISQVSTGTGISKPVIRGLGYNRVVVVNDGIRQEGQQWGDEHGIEIDEFGVERVEILKGPASLAYGSDAMAGVINMISAPTIPDGFISGNVLGTYQSNNGQYGYSANIAGNVKGFIWDLRYSGKQAHAYQNKHDNYVYGSAFKENTFGGILGVNKTWGYSHLHFSTYHLVPEIVEGDRDSASGKFIREIALDDSTSSEEIVPSGVLRSYAIGIPHQDILHNKAVLNSNIIIGNGYLKTIFGFQQNERKEFGDIMAPNDYGLFFLLRTINYDVRYLFHEKNNWSLSTGLNGMHQSSANKGAEFLVPQYSLLDAGLFFTVKKSIEKFDISGGIRFDTRNISSEELLLDTLGIPTTENDPYHEHKFKEFTSRFSSVSGSIGAAYKLSESAFTKLNVSRGFRAPNIAELGANGEHEGTARYEIGDPNLKAEYSLQLDYSLGVNTEHLSAQADLFYNSISNFIYTSKLNSVGGGDSIVDPADPIQTFKFRQGNANLFGGEATLDLHPHPLDWLHFESTFSYVQSVQENATDSTKYLPFTPAPKFTSELRANAKKIGKALGNAYIKCGIEHYFVQDKFYSAFGTETKTPSYTLLNIGVGTDFFNKGKTVCSLFINVNNLTDEAYQNHLSRLKYAAENFKTGRRGVYNMGRNISLKLIVPFNLKRSV
jgi:iron complex outermembrane recepter protein